MKKIFNKSRIRDFHEINGANETLASHQQYLQIISKL